MTSVIRWRPRASVVPPHGESVGAGLARPCVEHALVAVIVLNRAILGLETDAGLTDRRGSWLTLLDCLCLAIFVLQSVAKLVVSRGLF